MAQRSLCLSGMRGCGQKRNVTLTWWFLRRRRAEPGDVGGDEARVAVRPNMRSARQDRYGVRQRLSARPDHLPLQTGAARAHRRQVQVRTRKNLHHRQPLIELDVSVREIFSPRV